MRLDIKSVALLCLSMVVFLVVLSLSCLADTLPNQVPVVDSSTIRTNGVKISKLGNGYYAGVYNSNSEMYCFYVIDNNLNIYFASPTQNTVYYVSDNNSNITSHTIVNLDSTTGLYFQLFTTQGKSNAITGFPNFTNLADGLAAVQDAIEENAPVTSSLQYSLPPGNAIYIQVPQGASYTLKTRMPESVLGSNHYPGNNQAITLVQSLPSGGSAPTSPLIPWQQDGALSVLGLSRNAIYQGTNASVGYLCIVNPLYYSGTANGPYEFLSNGSIDITVDMQTGFVVYPLDSSLGFTSGLGINVDTSILDNPYTGEIDPETGEIIWQDSNGGTSAPTTGGGNLVSTSETIFDFLRNIGDEIATFLKGPIQAIQTVVSAIREFLGSFTQLYMWLPSPVYNLITSALMIALTIGVVKIFV